MHVFRVYTFHLTLLLSYIIFEFLNILNLLTLEIYIIFELIYYFKTYNFSKTNLEN